MVLPADAAHRVGRKNGRMPFTTSHVAAILPFARALVPAALVVGSMAPDLFYSVPTDVSRELSHSLPGFITVDLALGLAARHPSH
jgi:hypothetical protein